MILGLFIRNFKTYQGIHFIPMSSMHNLSGFLGNNGIGKSSILEALDCFFNNKKWNYNHVTKKSGLNSSRPYIVPIFSIKRTELSPNDTQLFDLISDIDRKFRGIRESDINIGSANKSVKEIFLQLHSQITSNFNNEYFLFPIGVDYEEKVTLSIFDASFKGKNEDLKKIIDYIRQKIDYVYIPKDIDSEVFTRLETQQIQVLMGESLEDILNDRITIGSLNTINQKLNEFISQLEKELPDYAYRTPTDRQQNIRKNNFNSLIIETFFNVRKLHKKRENNYIEIGALSSGEKQKAIIDVTYSLLRNHRKNGDNLIIAIDEPESSLHISACFEQFDSLFKISNYCRQILFSSHWYGFMPILNRANVCFISKNEEKDDEHLFDLISLTNYREQVLNQIRYSGGKLPYHINLKSITDLSQSIVTSIISEEPYNWLICEGTSEKIYFEKYFEEEIIDCKLRIIPVGGATKIKNLYNNIVVPYEDIKESVKTIKGHTDKWGKIFLLSDTDSEFVDYSVISDSNNLRCNRLINLKEKGEWVTKLLNINSNPKSPATEIEDCLNGKAFIETLKLYLDEYPELSCIIRDDHKYSEKIPSCFSLDLRDSEKEKLKKFFDDKKGENKISFAKKYINEIGREKYLVPTWVTEIKNWFKS